MAEQILEALSYPPIQRALLACLLCGASCALLSVFVVLMKMPLIGVSMSHAAFAGAVLGMLLDVNPFLSGLILCLLTAAVLGPLSDRGGIAPENLLGILFSFLLGIAFLGMGILTQTKAGALNLMWGSLLTLSLTDLAVLAIVTAVLAAFVVLFFKEIRAVLFNRRLAASAGVPERMIYYALLFLTGAVVSANLATVGGLLIFALLVQPGAAALQITYNLKSFFWISAATGVLACGLGLAASYIFDIPSGAAVVLTATLLFALAFVFSPKRRSMKGNVLKNDRR
ncbi:MAG: metal ABC transporter permease [Smithellaceae bacterium]|nr:metal ABC transporter permease [Smithellaceae bacterium]NLX51802.1 metal ABC transporter permease [Deltaproteobacteria bacterium]